MEDQIKGVADSIPREQNVVDRFIDRLKDFFNLPPKDPIIIELDGDGFREQTGWVAAEMPCWQLIGTETDQSTVWRSYLVR